MAERRRIYCIFGCDALVCLRIPFHRFPNPEKHPVLFAAWIEAIGDERLREIDPMKVYSGKRVCDHHFETVVKISTSRLSPSAIPSVNLCRVERSLSTFVEADHSYCPLVRDCGQVRALCDVTNITSSVDQKEPSPGPSGWENTSTITYNAVNTLAYQKKKAANHQIKKIRQLRNEVTRLRKRNSSYKLQLQQLNKKIAVQNFEKLTKNMSKSAKLFTRMQYIEGQKKKHGHRFTLEEKILSLSIFKKSPKAYNFIGNHFVLPSKKILKSLLAEIKISPGINNIIFKELKNTVSKMLPEDRLCTVIFDEMSISPQIHYNACSDEIVGFENYGENKTQNFANHVLVFMVKGVCKNFKQPVAYYLTQILKTQNLKEILQVVISKVQATGLKVIATVCDQSSVNVSTINSLISEAKKHFFQIGKEWRHDVIVINNIEIIPLFDVPHLIKGIRNNMLNKAMLYQHENATKIIKWEYFQWIYEADRSHGELRILPKLTNEHIYPDKIKKMRVKNAVQVLSHSMAVAAEHLAARGDIPPECRDIIPFVLTMDKLFDTLNASSFFSTNGKVHRAAVKRNSPHHILWQEALRLLKSIKFMVRKADGDYTEKYVPSVNNLIRTLEGFKCLWQLLSNKYSFDALLTRNLNQDPLENFFGNIRNSGARNVMPNCMGFEGAFKTLLLNNFSTNHSLNANCEEDSNECLQSLTFLLKNNEKSGVSSQSRKIVIDKPLDYVINTNTISETGADQRAYVCGWALTKCLKKVVKGCKTCKGNLLGDAENDIYKYMRAKEYCSNKKWLCYPSKDLIACFQEIQGITIATLNNECHNKNVKQIVKYFIDIFTDFNFLNCEIHQQDVKNCFIDTCINIIIYSWCRFVNRILDGKINYEGEDVIKTLAKSYYNKYKTSK